ncbi:MAG: serine O-acetyltransferase [Buchnera aphidicola (Nurudea yanoniella)]
MFEEVELIWNQILSEVQILSERDTLLSGFYHSHVLNHKNFSEALSYVLSSKVGNTIISSMSLRDIIHRIYSSNFEIVFFAIKDMQKMYNSDVSIECYVILFLYSKEFHALQLYRISNFLWKKNRIELAIYFQNCISYEFSIDIHPASEIGYGINLDHACGIVIGRTTFIKNDCSKKKSFTFTYTKQTKNIFCPKINKGVTIGTGAIILGNIEIGSNVSISPGSIILKSVYIDDISK